MIVEDGTGYPDSNSYVSVEYADEYFSSRGNEEWKTLDRSKKEYALINATDFIDNSFKWNGKKLNSEQALRFPRKNLFDYEGCEIKGIPNALKQAVCDCALMNSSGNSLYQESEANGAVTSETIGSLSFTYDVSKKQENKTLYDSVNLRLRGLYIDTNKGSILSARVSRV